MASKKSKQSLLVNIFLRVNSYEEMENLLSEVFSPSELTKATQRLLTTKALLNGQTYRAIESGLGSSTYMIHRAKRNIINSESGLVKELLQSLGELDE